MPGFLYVEAREGLSATELREAQEQLSALAAGVTADRFILVPYGSVSRCPGPGIGIVHNGEAKCPACFLESAASPEKFSTAVKLVVNRELKGAVRLA